MFSGALGCRTHALMATCAQTADRPAGRQPSRSSRCGWSRSSRSSASGGSQGRLGQYQSAINRPIRRSRRSSRPTRSSARSHRGPPTGTEAATAGHGRAERSRPRTARHQARRRPTSRDHDEPRRSDRAKATPRPTVTRRQSRSRPPPASQPSSPRSAPRKVVAVLFYNPAAADDRAVKQELALVPTHHGKVVKVAVPVSQLARYPVVTPRCRSVTRPDARADRRHAAGDHDHRVRRPVEIAQRIDDALSVK